MANSRRGRAASGALAVLLAACPGIGFAQSPEPPAAQLTQSLPIKLPTKLPYTSALASFQGHTEQPIQSWREANDQVGRIGGWKAYAKDAQAAREDAPPAPAGSHSHAGHHGASKP